MANDSSVLVRLRLLGGARFARDARSAGAGLKTIDGAGARVSQRMGGVNRMINASAVALRGVGLAAGAAAAAGLYKGVGASVNFEQSMANVQARLLTTKTNMKLLSDQAIDLGGKTSFSAQQAADAMGEFAAAGFSTAQIMKIMPGTLNLAAASGTDLAFAAETTGSMIRQFGLHAKDANHVADLMTVAVNRSAIGMDDLALTMKYVGPVAGRFNQSIEDVGAAAAILGNVGIKGETAGTTLRRAFVNLVKPSKRTVNMLDDMGISQDEFSKATVKANGQLRGMPQILGNLAGHFNKLTAPDQRKALAQLFGVEALPGMLTLMGKGEKGINKMSRSLQQSGGAAKRTAGIMRGTVKGAWDQFTGSLETASIKLLGRFNPALKTSLKGAAKLVTGLSKGLSGETGPRVGVGDHLQAQQVGGAQKAGLAIRGALGGVISWAQKNLPKVGDQIMKVGRQVWDAFKPAAPFFSNVLIPLLKGIAIGVIGGVVMAFKVAVPAIKIFATVLGFVGKVMAPFKGIIQGVGMVIGFIAGGPILRLIGGLSKVGVVFRLLAVPIRIANGAIRMAVGVVGRLAGVFGRAFTFVQRFIGTFSSAPARVARAALNIVGGVVNGLRSLPGKMVGVWVGAMKKVVGVYGRFYGAIFKGAKTLGTKVVHGIVAGIKAAPGAIVGAVESIIPGPLKSVLKKAGGFAGAVASLKPFAAGGVVNSPLQLVGERGPELARLPRGTRVHPAGETRRMAMAAARPMVAHVVVMLSGKQIHREVVAFEQGALEMA